MMKIRRRVSATLARYLYVAGITLPQRRALDTLSIVTFHRVLPDIERVAYPFSGLVVTPDELDEFLKYFTCHFDCGSLAMQHKRYLSGVRINRPLLAITFDDANYDNYLHARAILNRHQVNASFFVPVEAVRRQELLWHDQLGFAVSELIKKGGRSQSHLLQILATTGLVLPGKAGLLEEIVQGAKLLNLENRKYLMAALSAHAGISSEYLFARPMTFLELSDLVKDGHEIGSHSMTHCLMPECEDQTLVYELSESKRVIEDYLGLAITSFCYPNGDSDERTACAVAKAGYSRAVTTNWGSNTLYSNSFQLCRYDMDAEHCRAESGGLDAARIAFRMSGLHPGLNFN